MSHTFTSYPSKGNLHTTPVADHSLVLNAFVLPARTLPIPSWAKYSLTEKSALFWFKCPVVNSFRIFDFSLTPLTDSFRGSNGNINFIESFLARFTTRIKKGLARDGFLHN